MFGVAEVIATATADWDLTAVEDAVFGTGAPEAIARVVGDFCREQFGSSPVGAHFYGASAGCVLGLRLQSGADLVIKAYQERWSEPFLRATQRVQEAAARGGIVCAVPLRRPARLPGRSSLAVAETWLPDPGMRPLRGERERRASAAGLARQIAACDSLRTLSALADHPMRQASEHLYGEPHSPIFDFTLDTPSAGWVDDLAWTARRQRDEPGAPLVVAHLDWSARNVRVDDDAIAAVYDWDSVALATESTALGQAAMTWSVTAEPGGADFPNRDDVVAFVRDYEDAVGRRLSDDQWRRAGAAAVYLLAYTARCELSAEAAGFARSHQHGARDRLAADAAALLELSRP